MIDKGKKNRTPCHAELEPLRAEHHLEFCERGVKEEISVKERRANALARMCGYFGGRIGTSGFVDGEAT